MSKYRRSAARVVARQVPGQSADDCLANGDKNWHAPCQNCGELPTVHPTELCGPCCFGEADTAGGNW